MTRILAAAVPVPSHAATVRRVAADLASRGHDVTFISGPQFREPAEKAGLRFVPLPGSAGFPALREAEYFQARAKLPPGPPQLDYDFTRLFYEPVPDQHAALQQLLAEQPGSPAVILTDQSFMGHWAVRLGAPGIRPAAVIGIGVVPLSLSSADTAPFGLGLPPDSSAEGRARNAAQNQMAEEMLAGSTGVLRAILKNLGATAEMPFPMDAIVSLPEVFLQLAPAEAEYPRSDLPPGVRFAGPLPAEPADGPLPPWWDDVLAASRVIVVTQGTVANRDLSQLIEPALRALAGTDALVVATTGSDDTVPGEVPANARVAPFIPYSALLPHASVLVTNGGYAASLQALAHGVPLVIAGQSEDKAEVAARLAWTGAALNLATDTPSEKGIRAAVDTVTSDPAYRSHARRLQSAIGRHDPFGEIARAVTEVSGH